MNWPRVEILFVTYKRTRTAELCIEALKKHLMYPNLHWHVCDDGSDEADDGSGRKHIQACVDAIGNDCTHHDMGTPPGEFNMGGNTNRGVQEASGRGAQLYFVVQDDTILTKDLDLRPYADVLDSHASTGMVRFNYISTGMAGIVIPYNAPRLDNKEVVFWRLIREWSANTYLAAFQPGLYHTRFFDAYGSWPENYHPGLTECGMCAHYDQSELGEEGPQILVPSPYWPRGIVWLHAQQRAHHYLELTGKHT